MRTLARMLLRFVKHLPLLLLSPLFVFVTAVALAVVDVWHRMTGRTLGETNRLPNLASASIVIPNWNGKDLLEKYLPTVLAAAAVHPGNEVIVVENGSTDGSAAFLAERFPASQFPQLRVLAMQQNLGFGGGSNAGFRAAKNDVVVLLNSDMRVAPDFLAPLLAAFTDESVFAVACQIFFTDPNKLREETGLTQAWWENGGLRVRHRADEQVTQPFPAFYPGGGSSAFHRQKFLELGGFDEVLAPFYLEDTDLGYQAWKRGWKVLYQPQSHVWHEHRGTIGKKFSRSYIDSIIQKNFLLFAWKNIHSWRMLAQHFFFAWSGAVYSIFLADTIHRPSLPGLWRAFRQLPGAMRSRLRARRLARVDDPEAMRRPMSGYFFDRFGEFPKQVERPKVLFLSPYPILPPVHGGAVFMSQTIAELVKHTELHLIVLLDEEEQRAAHEPLDKLCASTEYFVRLEGQPKGVGSITPFAVREFANEDLLWAIHRTMLLRGIQVFQIEYTNMGQYAGQFQRIVNVLFEHDVYFQSIGRQIEQSGGVAKNPSAVFEYMRAMRYELGLLPKMDRVQMCSVANRDYVLQYRPQLAPKMDCGLRAGIDTTRYAFRTDGRQPNTLLFLGSFRHTPNRDALNWFLQKVWAKVVEARPETKLVIIGSDPPPRHSLPQIGTIQMIGFVEDVREALAEYAVFICPILAGSGVRVKLLEAYAAGIPVVSTTVGAEGLATKDNETCRLADDPAAFAAACVELLDNQPQAAALATRARAEVVANWDMATITKKLAESYRRAVADKVG